MLFRSRHPSGLYTLFFTEMWERFSYYGMRALLVLYLVNALEYPRSDALEVYATYTALVYLTPVLGGYLADRWLGARRAVLVGAILMALGHFAMAAPALLYLALGLLVAGNGFFKPNISTMVGALYARDDPRRDSGFTIFYMGINLGAFFSPLVCGTLGEKLGWHYGFAAAGVGMLAGLGVVAWGQRFLGRVGLPASRTQDEPRLTVQDWKLVGVVTLLTLALVYAVINIWPLFAPWWDSLGVGARVSLGLSTAVAIGVTPRLVRRLLRSAAPQRVARTPDAPPPKLTRVDIERIAAIFIMATFVVFFWMGFEQAGGTMNLFADKLTDRTIHGWEIPATYFQSVNPLLILLLAPLFSMLWVRLDQSRFALSSVTKQAIGMIILGMGFVVLAIAQQRADLLGKVGPGWLLLVYLLHTTGELCLSPIGLSMVTRLAPVHLVSLMMGMWFTAMALANYLAGTLEAMLHGSDIPLYWFLVASSMGAGVLLLLLSPLIRRLMHGVR
ncbi:MAG: peptide MFS transporter [Pseudomonadota bacterium]|nr:MAG: peptide MFS transporter [Pseudomonadota bacterium]